MQGEGFVSAGAIQKNYYFLDRNITRQFDIKVRQLQFESLKSRSNQTIQHPPPDQLEAKNFSRSTKMKAIFTTCSILLAFILMFASYNQGVEANKGHVHIKVWRGPSHGHKKHKFAPWGYKAKLPADDYKHHG